MSFIKLTVILITAMACTTSYAKKKSYKRVNKSSTSSLNSLGADDAILKKVRNYKAKHRVRVVQKRAVDRNLRFEIGANYGIFSGADPYTDTTAFGAQADFHINPRWSVGVRYSNFKNTYNAEAERISNENRSYVNENTDSAYNKTSYPQTDNPITSTMGVITWYPMYGKLNFFDWKVAQFDVYTLIGAGQIDLPSGPAQTMAFGGGLGVWYSQHVSSRIEMTYQKYQDEVYTGKRDQDMMTVTFTLGFMI